MTMQPILPVWNYCLVFTHPWATSIFLRCILNKPCNLSYPYPPHDWRVSHQTQGLTHPASPSTSPQTVVYSSTLRNKCLPIKIWTMPQIIWPGISLSILNNYSSWLVSTKPQDNKFQCGALSVNVFIQIKLNIHRNYWKLLYIYQSRTSLYTCLGNTAISPLWSPQ